MKMLLITLTLSLVGVALILLFTLYYPYTKDTQRASEELLNLRIVGEPNAGVPKKEKILKSYQSYYTLPQIKVFTKSSETRSLYIKLDLSLAYPEGSYQTENEIIQRRVEISSLIEKRISGKNYMDIDTIEEREELKIELLNEINAFMKNPISDIYYSGFMTLPIAN